MVINIKILLSSRYTPDDQIILLYEVSSGSKRLLTFQQDDDICYFQLNMKTDFLVLERYMYETLDSMLNNDQ